MIFLVIVASMLIGMVMGGVGVTFVSHWRRDRFFEKEYLDKAKFSPIRYEER